MRFSRENIYLRDEFTCQFCGYKFPFKKLTLDHVMPLSKGGPHNWENVVTACSPCNNKKADRTPKQANMPLLSTPRKPRFLPNRVLNKHVDNLPDAWWPYLPSWAG